MLQWSRERFNDEARRLVDALQCLPQENRNSLKSPSHFLNHWSLERSKNNGVVYLKHPVVRREISHVATIKSQPDEILDDEEDLFCDDTVLRDDPEVVVCSTINNATRNNASSSNNNNNITRTEWLFSIVYSDTWKAPVLYFTVQNVNQNGSPCRRSELVEILAQFSHTNRVENIDDSWDFLSHDEHPISRVPSFFLHPCQTLERLSTLVATHSSTEGHRGESASIDNDKCLLLSWMCMILPSVGHAVSSQVYVQLEELLQLHT